MNTQNLSQAHIRESIAGEEDPGASLDVVRAMLRNEQQNTERRAGQKIHMDYTDGTDMIGVDVGWQQLDAQHDTQDSAPSRQPQPHGQRSHVPPRTAADLLGLVVAYHGTIANTAWSVFSRTGQRSVALEVDEDADGVFYVSRAD